VSFCRTHADPATRDGAIDEYPTYSASYQLRAELSKALPPRLVLSFSSASATLNKTANSGDIER
jgi:hypothetical protein